MVDRILTPNTRVFFFSLTDWVEKSVGVMLDRNEDKKLAISDHTLSAEDFSNLYKIIFNSAKVGMHENKQKLSQERQKLITEGSFDKIDYIDKLLEDLEVLGEEHEKFEAEVLKQVNISKSILETSYEEYIGDGETIDFSLIKNSMTQFYIHPIKNG